MNENNASGNDLWIFREGRRVVASRRFIGELEVAIQSFLKQPERARAIRALLAAGELESALADSSNAPIEPAKELTDALAAHLWQDRCDDDFAHLLRGFSTVAIPEQLSISPAEGFAYYALHPLDFAAMAESIANSAKPAAVIGIRSIGTTLSAIVTAMLRHKGCPAARITVRPTGHPYDRITSFTPEQLAWIRQQNSRSADFQVVDEGPGRSGSSFLSVGEALLQAGVGLDRILFLGSRPVEPASLCARDAASRWQQFRFLWPARVNYSKFQDFIYIGSGTWRDTFLAEHESTWPECWPQMERFKFLSPGKHWLYKFEGFGRYGEEILERAQRLRAAGFGTLAEDAGDGMLRYATVEGDLLNRNHVSTQILERIADYCAFRAVDFGIRENRPNQLPQMLAFNMHQEFGTELNVPTEYLSTTKRVLVDGRMQPFEWVLGRDGVLIKLDGLSHGDDHFFPGPTDIAWDLAGVIIEWNLDRDDSEFFLSRYRCRTGDNPRPRIAAYLLAYTAFRFAYCKMALSTVLGTGEESRLRKAYLCYRALAQRLSEPFMPNSPQPNFQPIPIETSTPQIREQDKIPAS